MAKPKMKNRGVRIPEPLWQEALTAADTYETTTAEIVRNGIRRELDALHAQAELDDADRQTVAA